jgi:hypothetical protein
MVGLDVIRLVDDQDVAQAVKQLRAIGDWIDRLQLDALDIGLLAWAICLRLDIEAALAFPDARHGGQRAKIGQCVQVDIGRFGVDVVAVFAHVMLALCFREQAL